MSIPGVDYAWSHPGGAALKAAGKKFACRYLSSDQTKNLSKTEANDLAAHGVSSVVVWESTASRALGGKAAGAADAKTAASQAASCGMPSDRPIYFAVDFDATEGQQAEINAYLDGAASVLGRDRVGIYGGYYPVSRALDAKKATWAWQTAAWSGGQWDKRAHIRQGAQATIGGVGCDLNTAMVTDYGQWTPGHSPSPHIDPEDDDMTPEQAAQLKSVHDNLMTIQRVGPISKPEHHSAGYFLAVGEGHAHEAANGVTAIEKRLDGLEANVATLTKNVAAILKAVAPKS